MAILDPLLNLVKPFLHFIPEVKNPSSPPTFSQRLTWTLLALLIFYVMYNIVAVGVDPSLAAQSDFLQVVTASRLGSLLTTSIGPIVLASIFLQLFVGAKLIDLNPRDPEQRTSFYGTQKLLAILLCFFEAYVFVFVSQLKVVPLAGLDVNMVRMLVTLQVAMGSIILLYLDEVVSKHGLGSGISLFIAAGVSLAVVGGAVQLFVGDNGVLAALSGGGAEVISSIVMAMLPLFATIVVFLVVVYVEGVKIDIPLVFERAGARVTQPIKLTYVSNIPVILAFALIANFQFMALAMAGAHMCIGAEQLTGPNVDPLNACPGGLDLFNVIGRAVGGNGAPGQFVDGLFYFVSPTGGPRGNNYGAFFNHILSDSSPVFHIPEYIHVVIYLIFLMVVCVIFGQFWVETNNMGPQAMAEQLDEAGLRRPGWRDPRLVATMLEKYIPPIVIIGSAFVGLLAGLADLTGALGTGTGILLTVGILYRMYQDIERQNILETSAIASKLLG